MRLGDRLFPIRAALATGYLLGRVSRVDRLMVAGVALAAGLLLGQATARPAADAVAAQSTAGAHVIEVADVMARFLGRPATTSEQQLARLWGPTYAMALIRADDAMPLASIVPADWVSRHGLEGLTVGQYRARLVD